jgi:outer membrane lipase/esterase
MNLRRNISRYLSAPLAALFLTAIFIAGAQAVPYTGLVVFGDSLSDSGNNAIAFDAQGAPLPPGTLRTPTPIADSTFIPFFPYTSNVYSNGPVWVTPFAASLGLSAVPSLAGGTNFAFGGARVGVNGPGLPPSLVDQMGMFLGATGGVAAASNLYVVAGGGNDARDAFELAAGGGNPTALINQYALSIRSLLASLNAAGARDVLLVNIPDIGKTPAIRSFGAAASGLASLLAAQMNAALDAALASLVLAPQTHIFELDAYGLIGDIFANPSDFGLTNATSACAASAACIASPGGTFFWDGIHPTTAGHAVIAQAALRAVPEPATLLLVALGVLALGVRRRAAKST